MTQNQPESGQERSDIYGAVNRPGYFSLRTAWLGRVALNKAINVREFFHRDLNVPRVSTTPEKQSIKKQKIEQQIDSLKKMIDQSKEIVARVTTVFPFTLFPDDIVLDRTKVTIVTRNFFWSSNVISVRIEDILNVTCALGPFFGSVIISSRVMNSVDHFEIDRLWRRDAVEIKKLIQGSIFAKHGDVALDHLSIDELVPTLEELGEDASTQK